MDWNPAKVIASAAIFFGIMLFTAVLIFGDKDLLAVAAVLLLLACAALLYHIADQIDFLLKKDE